jgi:predicted TIM-barrel fold metal-dependent hydrolase
MVIDCHLHLCTFTPEHGGTSAHLLSTLPFRFMRWRLGMTGADASTERQLERKFAELMAETPQVDAAVVLAFDAVYTDDGEFDHANTHLYVTNGYVLELSKQRKNVLFGASVNPYRKDALKELEWCIDRGAVLLKWLPIVQGFDPSDVRCFPIYEMLAHHKVPLLAHTGGEKSLPNVNPHVADPMLLVPALERGVTVIGAHCGTKSAPGERDFLPEWCRLARDYENFYGDTAALNLPTRCYAYRTILPDDLLRSKLIHGSDWPILPLPPLTCGLERAMELMTDENWIRRDVRIKQALGLDRDYWLRAAKILRLAPSPARYSVGEGTRRTS